MEINSVKEQVVKREVLRHHNTTLYQGDSTNPHLFDTPFIDLIVTSPPYNVGIEYNSNHDELNHDDFCAEILEVFEKHNINGHVEWKR